MNVARIGGPAPLFGAIVATSAACAFFAPLWTYALTLGALGLPHVLAELRYVDRRFHSRIGPLVVRSLVVLLGLLALGRVLGMANWGISGSDRASFEILVLVGLVLVVAPIIIAGGLRAAFCAAILITACAAGLLYGPVIFLVTLAFLHNLTPLGFLAERLRGRERRRGMVRAAIAFLILPLGLAGLVLLRGTSDASTELAGIGALADHRGVFVPVLTWPDRVQDALFVAATHLQVMHYAVVLHVMPRWLDETDSAASKTLLAWPDAAQFRILLCAVGVASLMLFLTSFGSARQAYGVFAAVHAWIEIPILLASLPLILGSARQRAPA